MEDRRVESNPPTHRIAAQGNLQVNLRPIAGSTLKTEVEIATKKHKRHQKLRDSWLGGVGFYSLSRGTIAPGFPLWNFLIVSFCGNSNRF